MNSGGVGTMFQTRLKELREAAGYKSQQSFADAFGVAQSTVGNWEAGKREPNYDTTMRLAHFFGISLDYLLGRTDEKETLTQEGERKVEKQDLMAAFWGGDKDLSQDDMNAMWTDVENFAAFVAQQKKREKQK